MKTGRALRTARAQLVRRLGALGGPPPEGSQVAVGLHTWIEEVLYFKGRIHVKGWAFHPTQRVSSIYYFLPDQGSRKLKRGWGRPSPDVEAVHGPSAACARFELEIEASDPMLTRALVLTFVLLDGSQLSLRDLVGSQLQHDEYHRLYARFFEMLPERGEGSVLEIGSRARSGHVRRDLVPENMKYMGLDIVEGPNVDVVGDAHFLTDHFAHQSFDAIFALSTFEHLAMPWKVVLEMNAVLKEGGLVLITTHQTFPLHEMPWDYWRFSSSSWPALFHAGTGFEVVETAMGERASIVAHLNHQVTTHLDEQPSFLATAVICRKVGASTLRWDVDARAVQEGNYPQ